MQIFIEIFLLCYLISLIKGLDQWEDDEKKFYRQKRNVLNSRKQTSLKKRKSGDLLNKFRQSLTDDIFVDHPEKIGKNHIWPESFSDGTKTTKSPGSKKNKNNEKSSSHNDDDDESDLELQRLLGFVKEHKDKGVFTSLRKNREGHLKNAVDDQNKKVMSSVGRRHKKKARKRSRWNRQQNAFIIKRDFENDIKNHQIFPQFSNGFKSYTVDDNDGFSWQFIPEKDIEENLRPKKSGGEIVISNQKNETNIFSNIGNFLKKSLNLDPSSTTLKNLNALDNEKNEQVADNETTTSRVPIEVILPASSSLSNEKSNSKGFTDETDRISNISVIDGKRIDKMSVGSDLSEAKHATYEFEIKAIPIF